MSPVPDLFAGVDPEAVERVAVGFGRIMLAAAELVGPAEDGEGGPIPSDVFAAGMLKLHLTSVAAGIVHDHTDEEQDEELLEGVIAFLRAEVATLRGDL